MTGGPTRTTPRSGRGLASAAARFEERAAANRRGRRARIVIALLVLAALGGGAWLVLASSLFTVHQVVVEGVRGAAADPIRKAGERTLGTPLARVDTAGVAAVVREQPVVRTAEVTRSWPRTLTIRVTPRVAALAVHSGSRYQLADRDGVRFATVDRPPKGVPVVTVAQGAGEDPAALAAVLGVIAALPGDLRARTSSVTVSSARLVTFETSGVTVVWGGPEDSALKARILTALLKTKPHLVDVSAPQTPVTR